MAYIGYIKSFLIRLGRIGMKNCPSENRKKVKCLALQNGQKSAKIKGLENFLFSSKIDTKTYEIPPE